MAILTSRPGGRISRIRPASTYSGIVARYASQIQAAQEAKETADIAEQLLLYRAGSITFDELTANVNDLLKGIPAGTMRKVKAQEDLLDAADDEKKRIKAEQRAKLESARTNLTDKLVEQGINPSERLSIESALLKLETPGTEEYNRQQENVINSIENAESYKGEKRRAELMDQYKEGGITLEEELAIYQELRGVVNADSTIGRQYAEKEAQVMTSIQEEKERQGKAGAGAALAGQKETVYNTVGLNEEQNKKEMEKYQADPISNPGWAVDMAIHQNYQEELTALLSLPEGERGTTDRNNILIIQENIAEMQKRLDERQRGERFDVLTDATKENPTGVQSITLTELQNNPEFGRTDILSESEQKGVFGIGGGRKDELARAIITVDEGGRKAWIPDPKGGFKVYQSTGATRQFEEGTGKFLPAFKQLTGPSATRIGVSLNLQKALESGGLTFQPNAEAGLKAAIGPTLKRAEEARTSEQRIAAETALRTQQAPPVDIQRAIQSGGLTVQQPTVQPQIQPQPQPVDIQRAIQSGGLTVQQPAQIAPIVRRPIEPIRRVEIPQISFQPLAREVQRIAAPVVQQVQRFAQPVVQGVQQAVRGIGGFFGGLFGRK